jgi:multiple sugar transport system ATP-binding protein
MATVEARGLRKKYGEVVVLHGTDLAIADGEFVVLVGPSGCGKSTLLRMIAGLESITAGELYIGGKLANAIPPQRRNIAMVFQSYALYPHLDTYENMAFGPRVRREDPANMDANIRKAADILNLEPYLHRLPRALSGGQRQRVAMGRAIVRQPDLFLFDEPLSNLDAKLRVLMRAEIKALHLKLSTTTVYVTHDQIEAMTMADRIVVMNAGRIEQHGEPLELYDRPVNLFVAGFLGSPSMNFIEGALQREGDRCWLATAGGLALPVPASGGTSGLRTVLGIRPEHFELAEEGEGVPVTVTVVEPTGAETHLYAELAGTLFCAVFHTRLRARPGERLWLRPKIENVHLFDAGSGQRLAA